MLPGKEVVDKDLFSIALKQDELAEKLGKGIPRGTSMLMEGEIGSGGALSANACATGSCPTAIQ